jgi:hypothetical protein
MSAITEAVPAAPATREAAGIALICDEAMTASRLAEGSPPSGGEAALYAATAAAILQHTALGVILHVRAGPGEAASAAAIARAAELLPGDEGRLRLSVAEPLEALLSGVDLLVSFASPGLIAGCRNGLKPVQIGRAVIGSAAFSHVFPDLDGFVEALGGGSLKGGLSLPEYEQFEAFCRRVAGGGALWRLAEDPIIRACRLSGGRWRLAPRLIGSALANPFALWRLIRAGFGATAAL